MSTRIRYVSTDATNVFKSVRFFEANGKTYCVFLDFNDMTFSIITADGNEMAAEGTAPTSSSLKINAKKALADLGVTFVDESRKRGAKVEEEIAS